MKSLAMLAASLLLAGAATLGLACSNGGGGLSLEEYFSQVDEAQNEVDRQFEDAFQEEPGQDASEQDIATFARELIQAFRTIMTDADETFADIEPPAEAEAAHNALVQAIGEARTALGNLGDDVPDAIALDELDAFFSASEVEAPFMAIEEACKDLQQIADNNGIDVDLECEEEA